MALRQLYTRAIALTNLLLVRLYMWASNKDDDTDASAIPSDGDLAEMDEEMQDFGGFFHLGLTDILIIAVVIALFIVMSNSKLKKGCWYSVLYCILVILLIVKCT